MKKLISLTLAILIAFTIPCTALASEPDEFTEEELWEQIANNAATITHEVRTLDSYTQEEIMQNPELQQMFSEIYAAVPYSINSTFDYGEIYTTTIVTETGHTVVYRSYPKVTFVVTDVGTAGSADIYSTFKVIEAVNVDGNLNSGWDNAIRYKNISGTMGCGVNTAFTNDVTLSGNTASTLTVNVKGIISFVADIAGYNTVNQILNAFDMITYTGGLVSSRDITSEYVRVVGSNMNNEVLFSNDHNLTIQSSMSTIDSSQTANQSTKAVAEWTFDVYFFAGSFTPEYSNETLAVSTNYLVNVR